MFDWCSRLLHWRQAKEVITKGRQTQFIPWKGVYVVARQFAGRKVLTIINGNNAPAALEVKRYAEIIGSAERGTDITTGRTVRLDKDVSLRPRQTMVVEL